MGTTQVQAPTATTEGRSGLAGTRGPFIAGPICSLAASVWPRPNTGSRMSREVHVRFWERAGVRFPRATRLHVVLGHVVADVVAGLFALAHALRGAVQIAGDNVPADAAIGQMVQG